MSKLTNHWKHHFYFKILLLSLHIGFCRPTPSGYQIGEEYCPMCDSGNRVHKHCNKVNSTSCIPCTGSTFLDQPNGRTTCFPCTNCDQVSGLKVKQSCTSTSDAVCEALEGYVCAQLNNQSCEAAKEHSRCKPGQYISQQATSSKDTECSDCTGDTFSNGHSTCLPCTNCYPVSGLKVKQGCTSISDAVCEPLVGYFCAQLNNQSCEAAKERSRCKPGQYISQQATSSKDTECSDCTGDTFSNGSLTSCQPYTKCESLDKVQVSPGDHSSDTTCETAKPGVGAILIVIPTGIGIAFAIVGAFLVYCFFLRKKTRCMNTAIKKSLHSNLSPSTTTPLPLLLIEQPLLQKSTDTSLLPPV